MIAIPLEFYEKLRILADEYNLEIPQRTTHHYFWIDEITSHQIIYLLELKAIEYPDNPLIPEIINNLRSL